MRFWEAIGAESPDRAIADILHKMHAWYEEGGNKADLAMWGFACPELKEALTVLVTAEV